eukprot:gene7951-1167_t
MSLSAISERTSSSSSAKPLQSKEANFRGMAAFAAASTLAVLMHKSSSASSLRSEKSRTKTGVSGAGAAEGRTPGSGRPLGSRHNRYTRSVSGI